MTTLQPPVLVPPAPVVQTQVPEHRVRAQVLVAVVTPAMDKALRALLKAVQPRDPRALLIKAPPAPHPAVMPSPQVLLARHSRAVKLPPRRVLTLRKTGSRVAASRKR